MSDKKTFAIIALICGIISVLGGCIGFGIIFAIAAIVFFFISRSKAENAKVLRIIALITGILGAVGSVISIILGAVLGSTMALDIMNYL